LASFPGVGLRKESPTQAEEAFSGSLSEVYDVGHSILS